MHGSNNKKSGVPTDEEVDSALETLGITHDESHRNIDFDRGAVDEKVAAKLHSEEREKITSAKNVVYKLIEGTD